jgi:hypothetical protein
MCYNKHEMLILDPQVRCSAGKAPSVFLQIAAVLAMWIAVQPALAEDATSTEQPSAAVQGASAYFSANKSAKPKEQIGDGKNPSTAELSQSISRLGSADYRTREEAVRQLMAAGSSAIEPLKKAAQGQDLEVSYRAVRVLQSLLEHDDSATQQQAADALESLSAGEHSAADIATDALAVYHLTQQDRALESLRRLGATVREFGFGDDMEIILDDQWHGKTADLALLKQAPRMNHLQILYVKLDDEALKILTELTQLDFIELFGTGISEESTAVLAQALPGVKIDRRNGAMLGVGASPTSTACTINNVVRGSAAETADIHLNDEILSIDGHPMQRFEELTALIGAKNIGDSVSIDLRRDGQLLTKHVTLGKWERQD